MSSRPHRKLWVCEPGSTATSVPVNAGELVDDVKTLVLSRYANSLKAVDAANMTITIKPRPQGPPACYERFLSPDEDIFQLLDFYYPGGQKLVEALVISSAPRPKRNASLAEGGHKQRSVPARAPINWPPFDDWNEPATPVRGLGLTIREIQATPQQPGSSRKGLQQSGLMRSKSAGNSSAHLRADSGKFERSARDLFNPPRNSSSPRPERRDSSPSDRASSRKPFARRNPSVQPVARIRRPSPEDRAPSSYFAPAPITATTTATTQGSRPGSRIGRPLTTRPPNIRPNALAPSEKPPKHTKSSKPRRSKSRVQLDGAIPPINVLIAEDNSLVSRVVSKQMQQLNVRWDTAANGLEAVNKWKAGKFHLIFMDIGMPVMDGLAATKEIRRLERGGCESMDGDGDGVASTATAAEAPPAQRGPVIIVALTASSLPADRDSALNAGCNDFITKPLEQAWLQQKVKEWGCMQALINHEDWRIWRAYATQS
jgi:osomolarity two-component system response regulator SSK1